MDRFIQGLLLMVAGACSSAVGVMLLVFVHSLPITLAMFELCIMSGLFLIGGVVAFWQFVKIWEQELNR